MRRSCCRRLAALIAGNFEGRERVTAYAVIGGVAGAGIAVGPILGGWATTVLTWRVVFAGEVVLVLVILALVRYVVDAPREGAKPRLDVVGGALSALGLGAIVLGVLQSSTWGLVEPKDSPIAPLGFSLAIWLIGGGRGTALRLRPLAAPSRVLRAGPARAPRPHRHPAAAFRAGQPADPEPHPHGHLLRRPPVPAAGPRPGRPRDGHQDAARVDHDVRRIGARARGSASATRCAPSSAPASSRARSPSWS